MHPVRSLSRQISRQYSFSTKQYLPEVVERPFRNTDWIQLYKSNLSIKSKSEELYSLVHHLQLMQYNILPFSYDLYNWSCSRLIERQKDILKDDILMILRLSRHYKVKIEYFHRHIQNQIFLRIYKDYQQQIEDYDKMINQDIRLMIQTFNKNQQLMRSMIFDHSQNKQSQQSQSTSQSSLSSSQSSLEAKIKQPSADKQPQEMKKPLVQLSKNNKNKCRQKIFDLQDILEIMWDQEHSLAAISYLAADYKIIRQPWRTWRELDDEVYLAANIYESAATPVILSQQKEVYCPFDKKNIVLMLQTSQFQQFYYQQHLKQLSFVKGKLTQQHLASLISNYESFPIKKRSTRKKIGEIICRQLRQRDLNDRKEIVGKLLNMNKKDEKMKKSFRQWLGVGEAQQWQCKQLNENGDVKRD